jgi:hypothetical protein
MTEESSTAPSRISSQALDVLLKLEAEQIATLLPTRFGLDLARILRPLPTELPQLSLHLQRLDTVFELEDGSILHLEFQARLAQEDLLRFLQYALALIQAYPGRKIHTVVLCGPGVRKAPPPIDLGLLPYKLSYVLIGILDGDATLDRLRALVVGGGVWTESDRLDLYLLLLMRHRRDTETVARAGLELAEALPTADRPRVIGAILSLAYHYQGQGLLDRLVEELMSTQVWEQQLVESLQRGIEQGIEQGIEKGRAEGQRELLRHAVIRRFGAIPPSLETRIADADAETLAKLFDHVLVAVTSDDI